MFKRTWVIVMACLLASWLASCDKLGLGPIEESRGSLEGGELSFFVIHVQSEEDSKSLSSSELRSAMHSAIAHLEEMKIDDFKIGRRDNGSLMLQVRAVDEAGAKKIQDGLTKVTTLALHQVSERNDEIAADGRSLAQRVLDGDEVVVGQIAYLHAYTDYDGNERSQPILLYRRAAITASDIADAYPSPQQPDAIGVTLDAGGTDKMIGLTKDMRPGVDRIAIVLNGEVVSAPVVNATPLGKRFIIEGLDEAGEVESLANQLMHPSSKPFRVEQVDSADE